MLRWWQKGMALLMAVTVAHAANLHLPFVQAVAWAQMYAHYKQSYPSRQALQITFSGKAPCALCKYVNREQQSNPDAERLSEALKQLLPLPAALAVIVPPAPELAVRYHDDLMPMPWVIEPETPPPRLA